MTFRLDNITAALEIMGKGMAGIFVTILIIMIFVGLLGKIAQTKKENQDEQ